MEVVKSITKDTLIPIGLVITLVASIFYLGKLSQKIEYNSLEINTNYGQIEQIKSSYVSKEQFDDFKTYLDEKFTNLENLIKK